MKTSASKRVPGSKNGVGKKEKMAATPDLSKFRVKLRENAQKRLSGGQSRRLYFLLLGYHPLLYLVRGKYHPRVSRPFLFPAYSRAPFFVCDWTIESEGIIHNHCIIRILLHCLTTQIPYEPKLSRPNFRFPPKSHSRVRFLVLGISLALSFSVLCFLLLQSHHAMTNNTLTFYIHTGSD